MAKIRLLHKKNMGGQRMGAARAGDPAPTDFALVDNGDTTVTIGGIDKAGNPVDISAIATLSLGTPSSSDETKVKADSVNGMTFAEHAVGPLGTGITVPFTVTMNDGQSGPFQGVDTVDVVAGPAAGVNVISHSAPTLH